MSGDSEEKTPRRKPSPSEPAASASDAPAGGWVDLDDDLDDERLSEAAAELRALPEASEPPIAEGKASERATRVLAITGARGGAGRTVIASNLALYLSTIGRKVVLVDA